jgi:hypothetical protein
MEILMVNEDVMGVLKSQFVTCCCSPEIQLDFAMHNKPVVNPVNIISIATPVDVLTAQDFRLGMKQDMTQYQ